MRFDRVHQAGRKDQYCVGLQAFFVLSELRELQLAFWVGIDVVIRSFQEGSSFCSVSFVLLWFRSREAYSDGSTAGGMHAERTEFYRISRG